MYINIMNMCIKHGLTPKRYGWLGTGKGTGTGIPWYCKLYTGSLLHQKWMYLKF